MIGRRGIEIKTPDQLRLMRRAGQVVAEVHRALTDAAAPGVTTRDLDELARDVLARRGAQSSFLGYGAGWGYPPYPAVTCISVNEEIVHGIPGGRVLAHGDLVSVDFGAIVDGWHGDGAVTFGVGDLAAADARLSEVTRESLWAGIGAARLGGRIGTVRSERPCTGEQGGKHVVRSDHPEALGLEPRDHRLHQAVVAERAKPDLGEERRGPRVGAEFEQRRPPHLAGEAQFLDTRLAQEPQRLADGSETHPGMRDAGRDVLLGRAFQRNHEARPGGIDAGLDQSPRQIAPAGDQAQLTRHTTDAAGRSAGSNPP